MTFTAYVAGRLDEIERVRHVQQLILDAGGVITLDWTSIEGNVRSNELDPEQGRLIAEAERNGVFDADLVVLCHSETGMRGAYIEVGMALAHNIPVVVLDCPRKSVFWYLPEVTELQTEELPEWLARVTDSGTVTISRSGSGTLRLGDTGVRP